MAAGESVHEAGVPEPVVGEAAPVPVPAAEPEQELAGPELAGPERAGPEWAGPEWA